MNGSRVLLDTNSIIAVFAGNTGLHPHIERAEAIFVPVVAVGELYFGAHESGQVAANIERIDQFVAENEVLPISARVSIQYGRVKDELHRKGRPIPENDIWIAATALHHDLTVVTRDAHFAEIEELRVESW